MKSELLTIIESYLHEEHGLGNLTIRDVAQAYGELVGTRAGTFVLTLGYHEYLLACGYLPSREHLCRPHIEAYRKFLAIHCGVIRQKRTFDALRPFVKWCAVNGYVDRVDTRVFNVVWPFRPRLVLLSTTQKSLGD